MDIFDIRRSLTSSLAFRPRDPAVELDGAGLSVSSSQGSSSSTNPGTAGGHVGLSKCRASPPNKPDFDFNASSSGFGAEKSPESQLEEDAGDGSSEGFEPDGKGVGAGATGVGNGRAGSSRNGRRTWTDAESDRLREVMEFRGGKYTVGLTDPHVGAKGPLSGFPGRVFVML